MEIIENRGEFAGRFSRWRANDALAGYPWVRNIRAPLTPLRRALPMLNLALISSAGAYIDGTEPFDTTSKDGDLSFREFPVEIEASDLRYDVRGYDPTAVTDDRNSLIPIDRLLEYQGSAVIGQLNNVWWSVSSHIPNAARVASELGPQLAERLNRYEVHAALFVPASRLCHQTLGIVARAVEAAGIPTMLLSVDTSITDQVRPPRAAYYNGELGATAGRPNWR
ncbi:MAG: glycine/sarcosine/betaine reductase selenoprotein B family protein, partial [Pyrinomonadaceae bacterium]